MSLTSAATLEGTDDPAASRVVFKTSQGIGVRGIIRQIMPQSVTMEIYDPTLMLRTSEALTEFKIILRNHAIYSGRAVVHTLMEAGDATLCKATLEKNSWRECVAANGNLAGEFAEFVRDWQKYYLVSNDYKVVIADIQTFLAEMRLWLEQVELTFRHLPEADRVARELEIAHGLRPRVSASLNNMFERFELLARTIEPELQPVHRAFGQRQLHPYLLCAPFIHRTFVKPMGYAGDYEMMNMIVRNGLEGASLYAKLANAYLLDQGGSQAVRNRVDLLHDRIINETARAARLGRVADVYSIACGPAWEAVNFVANHPLADHAHFHMLDFNEETLQHAGARLEEAKRRNGRKTGIQLVRNSVQNLLRGGAKSVGNKPKYDLIYCSGLYDYLNDRIIKALNTYLYDQLRPDGLLVVGNFAPCTPVRQFIEHFLEWFLIYRDGRQLAESAPPQAHPDDCRVVAETSGANIFLEVRKPL